MRTFHLLITRFNIQYEEGNNTNILPIWLDDRILLFEKYCLPSILKQTSHNFTWLLLGDIRTPEKYKKHIENYHSIISQVRTIWTPFQEDGYHALYKKLANEFAKESDILISTRLDNDDALAADYMARIQEIAQRGVMGIVSFPLGKQTFEKDNKSYNIIYKQNHFLTRIETGTRETILAFDHTKVPLNSLYLEETSEPMWEEIVHGNNVANSYMPAYYYYTNNSIFGDAFHIFEQVIMPICIVRHSQQRYLLNSQQ